MSQPNKKKILVVDDSKINIDILIELLDDKYELLVSLSGRRALEILNNESVDLILLDILMPDMSGYDVCKVLKTQENTKSTPIIFITANSDEESIELAYEAGGIDYVTKPFKALELLARIKTQLNMQDLLSDLEESHSQLKLLASQDHMTKLYNRRYFSEISTTILELAIRHQKPLSILMIDIDKFKNINDTYGHHIGDLVIISLANKLKELSRKSDIVCRFGGEEFLILLPETDTNGGFSIAEKIRKSVETTLVDADGGKRLKYTISTGISEVKIKEESDLESTIQRADEALYEAKESGRNRVCKR